VDNAAEWEGQFGSAYTTRQTVSITARRKSLGRFWPSFGVQSILEVGCGAGYNLRAIRTLAGARRNLQGIDANETACAEAVCHGLSVRRGVWPDAGRNLVTSAFDLVFTAGVLIHVPPVGLEAAMREIARVAKRYVLAVEYARPNATPRPVTYRGRSGMMWACDYGKRYLDLDVGLELVSTHLLPAPYSGFDDCTAWLLRHRPESGRAGA